jgi:hypothetical protein
VYTTKCDGDRLKRWVALGSFINNALENLSNVNIIGRRVLTERLNEISNHVAGVFPRDALLLFVIKCGG